MRKIPKKNYLILFVLSVLTIGIMVYLGAWYKEANKYKYKSVISALVTELSSEEFGNYITENPNGLLYVSSPIDTTIKSYEKELSKILKNNDLIKETVYIDLDKNPSLELSPYYIDSVKKGMKETTNLYVVNEGKIIDYLAHNKNSYTKEKTIELLEKNGVINDNE